MKQIYYIVKKELFSYFLSPVAYIVLLVFLLYNGYHFYIVIEILNQPMGITGSPMSIFFGQTIFFYLILIVLCSIITMKSLAEERRSGTLETLLTAPVSDVQVVVAKFASSLLFYIFLWAITVVYPLIIEYYSNPNWGPIASGYLGTILVGGFFISVGILTSALTRSQLVSSILTFLITGMIFVLGLMEYITTSSGIRTFFSYINIWGHMEDFSKGIVDSRRIVYYLSMIVLALYAAIKALKLKRLGS